MAKNMNPTKVITGKDTRWSYCNVWDAKSINGGTPKYSVSLIIPQGRHGHRAEDPGRHRGRLSRRGEQAARQRQDGAAAGSHQEPAARRRYGAPDDPAYANAYFVNANSATAPGVVDSACNPILTRSEVYSGVYGRASISFYAFNSNGNRGIACGSTICRRFVTVSRWAAGRPRRSDFADEDDEDFLS